MLDDDFLIWETLNFLIEQYHIAKTTQIHPFLESNLSLINKHINMMTNMLLHLWNLKDTLELRMNQPLS